MKGYEYYSITMLSCCRNINCRRIHIGCWFRKPDASATEPHENNRAEIAAISISLLVSFMIDASQHATWVNKMTSETS
jgi:hypothetical protein